jgi:hypothetical protein
LFEIAAVLKISVLAVDESSALRVAGKKIAIKYDSLKTQYP